MRALRELFRLNFYAVLTLKFLLTWLRGKNQCEKCFFLYKAIFSTALTRTYVNASLSVCGRVRSVCVCLSLCEYVCVSKCVGAQLNMADSVVGNEEAAVLPHIKTYS